MKCPLCTKEIKCGAIKCRSCGKVLDLSAYESAKAQMEQRATTTNEQPSIRRSSPKHPVLRWLAIIAATVIVTIAVIIIPVVLEDMRKSSSGPSTRNSSQNVDPDPTGTWVEGDQNSVYNRLVVRSSGSFSFQTVDFTGDVKGGFSGRWSRSDNSIQFQWGGVADGGSCSGYRSGPNSLVFGGTTFYR